MSTQLDPTQLTIEFLRHDQSNLSLTQYLKHLKQLELEFVDLLTLSSAELKEEVYFAWCLGVYWSWFNIASSPNRPELVSVQIQGPF